MKIASPETALHCIELPVPLSGSTHGTTTHFGLATIRLRDDRGCESGGCTYTIGAGGAAVHVPVDRGPRPVPIGADPGQIEALWQKIPCRLHYGGRGGSVSRAVSAWDIALRVLKARRLDQPLWRLRGGFDPAVPCYAGGIDLDFTPDALPKQTDGNPENGFRAVKMKVGRARLSKDRAGRDRRKPPHAERIHHADRGRWRDVSGTGCRQLRRHRRVDESRAFGRGV